jgi:hypothetical protein
MLGPPTRNKIPNKTQSHSEQELRKEVDAERRRESDRQQRRGEGKRRKSEDTEWQRRDGMGYVQEKYPKYERDLEKGKSSTWWTLLRWMGCWSQHRAGGCAQ